MIPRAYQEPVIERRYAFDMYDGDYIPRNLSHDGTVDCPVSLEKSINFEVFTCCRIAIDSSAAREMIARGLTCPNCRSKITRCRIYAYYDNRIIPVGVDMSWTIGQLLQELEIKEVHDRNMRPLGSNLVIGEVMQERSIIRCS